MQKLLLILSFTFGLVSPVFALKAGETHADPYKVMTEGYFIGQELVGNRAGDYTRFIFAYQGDSTVVLLLCHCRRLKEL